MFEGILSHYFSKLGVALNKSFTRYTSGAISACSFSTHEIARHVSKTTGKDFNTSEKGLNYLLCNDKFQIDDVYWRQHVNMIFDMMVEQNLLHKGDTVYLQIDFTSNENYFLILTASIIVNNRAIPLYFTMRKYPKKKNQYNHKKMEEAFLKGLKHVLSKKYNYVVLADRGFANDRFLNLCTNIGFDYVIRATPNFKIQYNGLTGIMDEICTDDGTYKAYIVNLDRAVTVHKCSNAQGSWYLLSSMQDKNHDEMQQIYKNRFKTKEVLLKIYEVQYLRGL